VDPAVEKGEGQGEEVGLGRPGTFLSTLSTAHLSAYQHCSRAHLKNPKCTKTLGGRGFAPDTTVGAYSDPGPLAGG